MGTPSIEPVGALVYHDATGVSTIDDNRPTGERSASLESGAVGAAGTVGGVQRATQHVGVSVPPVDLPHGVDPTLGAFDVIANDALVA